MEYNEALFTEFFCAEDTPPPACQQLILLAKSHIAIHSTARQRLPVLLSKKTMVSTLENSFKWHTCIVIFVGFASRMNVYSVF